MRRFRNIPGRTWGYVRDTDNIMLLLVTLLLLWVLAAVIIPNAGLISSYTEKLPLNPGYLGLRCRSLAPPNGGYSRSMLASVERDGPQDLRLDVALTHGSQITGTPLNVTVIFRNEDRGPVILFLPEYEFLEAGGSPNSPNIVIEITQISTRQTFYFSAPFAVIPAAGTAFRDRELHLIRSERRCAVEVEINPQLPPGDYTVRAFYSNTNAGALINNPNEGVFDPALFNQGVWTAPAPIESDLKEFAIISAPTQTPIPPPPSG